MMRNPGSQSSGSAAEARRPCHHDYDREDLLNCPPDTSGCAALVRL
jgi:hypothetical protein